jgi:hypothetical protein
MHNFINQLLSSVLNGFFLNWYKVAAFGQLDKPLGVWVHYTQDLGFGSSMSMNLGIAFVIPFKVSLGLL